MADHKNLAEALAAFQMEVPRMSKDETAKVSGEGKNGPVKYTYGYAGLDQFVEIVEPILGKHGLAITSTTTFDAQGNFILEVKLLHESGEELGPSVWPLPDPRRYGPQDIGSSMTYGRRYLGWGLTGTFPGGTDDDGLQAQQAHRESWDDARPKQQAPQNAPVSAPPAAKTTWTDDEVIGYQAKLANDADLTRAVKGYDWMASKDIHNRTVDNGAEANTATMILAVRLAEEALVADRTAADIDKLKSIATDRGLIKVPVSKTETLGEVLHSARELALHAADELAQHTINEVDASRTPGPE